MPRFKVSSHLDSVEPFALCKGYFLLPFLKEKVGLVFSCTVGEPVFGLQSANSISIPRTYFNLLQLFSRLFPIPGALGWKSAHILRFLNGDF